MKNDLLKLSDALLEQVAKDGMSMLLGGGIGDVNQSINNGGTCNEINHGLACDVINNGASCAVINNKETCGKINNQAGCRLIKSF